MMADVDDEDMALEQIKPTIDRSPEYSEEPLLQPGDGRPPRRRRIPGRSLRAGSKAPGEGRAGIGVRHYHGKGEDRHEYEGKSKR